MRENKIFRKKNNQKEEEQTKFEWLVEEIKSNIFGVFYILLKQNETSIWKFAIMNTVLFLQLISYSFEQCLGEVWKAPDIIKYLTSFLSTFRLVYWLEKVSWDVYIIIYYMCILILFLIIIDFVYVAYCYKNRKFPFIWPIQVLRYSCTLIISFFFIPLIELFMSFSNCTLMSDGVSKHKIFKNVQCFTGIHVLHATLSYFIMAIFLAMSFVIVRCYYESRHGKGPLSKMHSNSNLLMLAQKFIFVFAFTFFSSPEYYWFLSVTLFVCSLAVFLSYSISRPYFLDRTQKIVDTLNGLFVWANTVLLLSCFIYVFDFTGNLVVCLLGVPFIFLILINQRDNRKQYLMQGMQRIQKGEDAQRYVQYFLSIIEQKDDSREANMILKGYVNHHSEFCPMDDCPLKNFKKQMQKDQKKLYGQFGQTQTIYTAMTAKNQVTSLESHPLLISQAKSLYMNGIKKFPQANGLKIDFAQFLLQNMHNKKDALKELINAEKTSPSLEQQFIIFRYRQLIEDELHEGTDASGGGLDYVAALNFETYFNQFKGIIEKSAFLHYEFWNHLMDDSPDLARLSDQGSKINASIQSVEDQWKKLSQQSTQTPKALRLYASYLIEILNDKEMGNEQLMKAKEAAISRVNFDFNNIHEDASDMSSFAADGSPCVYISGEQDRLGIITQCNMSVCKVFGYSKKEELLNHEVEILMPKIYARQHKKFLDQAIQKPPDLLSNKERQVFGKHYSGTIFPLWLSIKNLPSFLSGRQFVATFKIEKSGINKNVAHLILDKNKEVIDISSSCLTMLEIDLQKFQKIKAKLDISLLLPSLFGANYYQFITKTGCQIEYQYPQMVEIDKKAKGDNDDEDQDDENDPDVPNEQINENDDKANESIAENLMNSYIRAQNNGGNYNMSMIDEEEEDFLNGNGDNQFDDPILSTSLRQRQSHLIQPGGKKFAYQTGDQIDEEDQEDEDSEDPDSRGYGRKRNKQYDFQLVASNKTANFQCNMIEIHFETPNLDNPNPGYYIRLETLQDKQPGAAKIQKTLKQNVFQFSYDSVFRRFNRELRDKDNKEILIDKHYLSMKKIKEGYLTQQKQNPNFEIPHKIQSLTYMTYLNKYQKWVDKGMQGNLLDDQNSDNSSNESDDEIDEEDTMDKTKRNTDASATTTNQAPQFQVDQVGLTNTENIFDLKKFIPGEGSGKDFLKNEIERMINLLRKKQECSFSVHTFRRLEPGAKVQGTPIALGQSGKWEEAQFSVAGLFAGRSSADKSDIDDDNDLKDEDGDREKSNKNDSLRNSIKSRKAFSMAINDKSVPAPIQRLSRITNIILLCLLAIAIVDYAIMFKQLKDTITNYEVIEASFRRIAEIQKVCYNVRSMIMLNQNMMTNYYGYSNRTAFVNFIKQDLQYSLNELYGIQNSINLAQLDLSNEHQDLLDEKTVSLYFKQDVGSMKSLQFSLTEAILQIQSSIFTVSNMQLSEFSELNQDVFFLMYNAFNELHIQIVRSSNLYVNELTDRSKQKSEISMILLILSICSLFIVVLVLIPVVASVNRQKDKVLSLFCDIDDSTISKLVIRCEKFITKVQAEDNNEEMDSNEDFDNGNANRGEDGAGGSSTDEDYSMLNSGQKKSKRAKNQTRTNKLFYVKFILAILIVEAYYSYNYGMMRGYTDLTIMQADQMNITCTIEPFYWFSVNSQREYYYNASKPILNQNAFKVTQDSIFRMYEVSTNVQDQYLSNMDQIDEAYQSHFTEVMIGDLCSLSNQVYFKDYNTCAKFLSGIPTQGLGLVLVVYIRISRLAIADFQSSKNQTKVINSQDMYDIYVMQHEFIQLNMRQLVSTLNASIIENLNNSLQERLFLLILFLIVILLSYVSIWVPLVNSLNNQIYKTKLMLMIIPLEILMRMKNVGKVLQSQNFIQEKSRNNSGGASSRGSGGNGGGGGSSSSQQKGADGRH